MTLTQNGVITEEAMLAYLNGMLTSDDTIKFEQLLNDDPFAREALEGLQTTTPSNLKPTFKEVNQAVADRTGAEPKTASINFQAITRYAVAAALVGLLIGLGFLVTNYVNNQQSQLAMETKQEGSENTAEARPFMEAETPAIIDSIVAEDTAELTLIDDVSLAPSASATQEILLAESPIEKEVKVEAATKRQEELAGNKKAEEQKKPAPAEKSQVAKSSAKTPLTATGSAGAAAPTYAVQSTPANRAQGDETIAAKAKNSNAKEEIAADYQDNMDAAMQSFNNHDYKTASKQFGKILDKEPENKDALYFQSVSEYINGNNKGALKGFEKLLDQNTKHIEGSKYYKSQILLKKGKKDEAQTLLEELSRSNGAFKQRAIEKLGELK
jgi:hypothetical protein